MLKDHHICKKRQFILTNVSLETTIFSDFGVDVMSKDCVLHTAFLFLNFFDRPNQRRTPCEQREEKVRTDIPRK